MNKILNIIYPVFILLGLLFGFSSCKEEKAIPPVLDICGIKDIEKYLLTGKFKMEEFTGAISPTWEANKYDTDTAITRQVMFTALDSTADAYKWEIGAGVYTKRIFALDFHSVWASEGTVPIKLTVYKKRNEPFCEVLRKDTIQSSERKLTFRKNSLVRGSFFGYLDNNPADTITIHFDGFKNFGIFEYGEYVRNLTRNCGCIMDETIVLYKFMAFNTGFAQCFQPSGRATLKGDSIFIDYKVLDGAYCCSIPQIPRKFVGKRKPN